LRVFFVAEDVINPRLFVGVLILTKKSRHSQAASTFESIYFGGAGELSRGRSKALMIPIRCFTCGAVVGDKWEDYKSRVYGGEDPGSVLNSLGLKRYCCRRMIMSHVEVFDEVVRIDSGYGGANPE